MTRGLRTEKRTWVDPTRRPAMGLPPRKSPVVSAQVQAERDANLAEFEQRMIARWNEPLIENDATRKVEDMKARVTVEGDTDLNHDNVEAAE